VKVETRNSHDKWAEVIWQRNRSLASARSRAPALPGVYAIASVSLIGGLPIAIEWVYVGRSKNLHRRLNEHDPIVQAHPLMKDWLLRQSATVEVWYSQQSEAHARRLEDYLIRTMRPRFNRAGIGRE
jgi:excinuclease UvrABC nuclease subunit